MAKSEPKPPKPPSGAGIRIADGTLHVDKWKTAAKGATIDTVDGTGKRVTVTRLFLTGPFAFALKKRAGAVSVVVCAPDGNTKIVEVSAKRAQDVMAWAIAFNAWSQA